MMKKPAPHGNYIPAALEQHCLNGDAYISMAESYRLCCGEKSGISYSVFQNDLVEQFGLGRVVREGPRLYMSRTFLMPITDSFSNMLYRNLLYTAISRGKKKVILYGSQNALGVALQKSARERRSQLVAKTHTVMMRCVG